MRSIVNSIMLVISFHLGMSMKEAQVMCPKPLVEIYAMLHEAKYVSCDDGVNTTVLVFQQDKLIAMMDIKYFVTIPGF